MIKKIKSILRVILVLAVPVSLYTVVYSANVEKPVVAKSAVEAQAPVTIAPAKTVVLAENTKPVVKKPVVKKAPVKKKVVKKKAKKKERLIPVPALITPETAPHTGR